MTQAWNIISIICFVAAAVFLILAVVMFFVFDIRKISKELSGKHVENYMEEYRKKKEESKRVGIYDPSGKLISNVKSSNVAAKQPSAAAAPPRTAERPASMGDKLASSRASAAIKSDGATQVLSNNTRYENFRIIKDYVYSESKEYIG